MRQISLSDFIDGFEKGYIKEVFSIYSPTIGTRVYGKDPRGIDPVENIQGYEIVYALIP